MLGGSLMGKRYVDTTGAEVLVTTAGPRTLSVGSVPLTIKEAEPLLASDWFGRDGDDSVQAALRSRTYGFFGR